MIAIESTRIQTEAPPGTGEQIRPDTALKKGAKDALGAFARLLAGLVNKTPQLKPEGSTTVEGAADKKSLSGAKKTPQGTQLPGKDHALSLLTEKKGSLQNPGAERKTGTKKTAGTDTENAALAAGLFHQEKTQTLRPGTAGKGGVLSGMELSGTEHTGDKTPGTERAGRFQEQTVSMKQASMKQERFPDMEKRRFPFYNQNEAPGPEMRNAVFRFGRAEREEKNQPAEGRNESRKSERRRDRIHLDVRDMRTQTGTESTAQTAAEVSGRKGAEEARNSVETVVELRAGGGGRNGPGEPETAVTESAGERFSEVLARELRGDLSTDIVKQAAVILKDNQEGTIRLSLKPESLGKVKIQLEMSENRISGNIVVESEEALRAFEQEIHSLEQSFRDSGFEASLSAALDYRNGGQQRKEETPPPFFSERFAAYDAETESTAEPGYLSGFGLTAINVLA